MADFFKKLNEGKTAPEGDLIIASNLKSIEPDLDQDDPAALFAAGYCIHLNTFKEAHRGKDNYTHKWVNNGEKELVKKLPILLILIGYIQTKLVQCLHPN